MSIEKKYIFWLLCCIQKLDSILLKKLFFVFGRIDNMYNISQNLGLFKEMLYKNNLFFSNDIFKNFLNSKLKIQSNLLYSNIVSKGIDVVKIKISDRYIYTLGYGNKNILNNKSKKIYFYNSKTLSQYGKNKIDFFYNHEKIKEYINVSINNNIIYRFSNIIIKKITNINELRSVDTSILNSNNLYLFSLDSYELMSKLCDIIFLVEAKYEENIVKAVDSALELGKDILVVPGDVWNKNNYFSNYLIKEGAQVILGIDDLNFYL